VVFALFWVLVAILLLYYGYTMSGILPKEMECDQDYPDNNSDACYGMSFVNRISFILMLFHLAIFIVVLPRK